MWEGVGLRFVRGEKRFNPCSGGILMWELASARDLAKILSCFNPCSGGILMWDIAENISGASRDVVSILVLVEYWCETWELGCVLSEAKSVSILVLVEYWCEIHREGKLPFFSDSVSILVLVEYWCETASSSLFCITSSGFNPCSGGILMWERVTDRPSRKMKRSFNPCSGGILMWDLHQAFLPYQQGAVSILVLVEYWCENAEISEQKAEAIAVSILVLVEYWCERQIGKSVLLKFFPFQSLFWWNTDVRLPSFSH